MKNFWRHLPYAIVVALIAGLCNMSTYAEPKPLQPSGIMLVEEYDTNAGPVAKTPASTQQETSLAPVPLESYRDPPNKLDQCVESIARLQSRVDRLENAYQSIQNQRSSGATPAASNGSSGGTSSTATNYNQISTVEAAPVVLQSTGSWMTVCNGGTCERVFVPAGTSRVTSPPIPYRSTSGQRSLLFPRLRR